MKQTAQARKRTTNAQLAISPGAGDATTLWSSPQGWRIGRHADENRPLLAEVIEQACNLDWTHARARAWQLLLQLEATVDALHLVGSLVAKLPGGSILELSPFFALHACRHPVLVASLFPRAIVPEVLPLCGQAGADIALRTLSHRDSDHRLDAAHALEDCFNAGLSVPAQPIAEALRKETNRDVADQFRELLARMQAGKLDESTRRMIVARLFGDAAAPETLAGEFAVPIATILAVRDTEAERRAASSCAGGCE